MSYGIFVSIRVMKVFIFVLESNTSNVGAFQRITTVTTLLWTLLVVFAEPTHSPSRIYWVTF